MAFMWFSLCNNVAFDELNNLTKLVKYVSCCVISGISNLSSGDPQL